MHARRSLKLQNDVEAFGANVFSVITAVNRSETQSSDDSRSEKREIDSIPSINDCEELMCLEGRVGRCVLHIY